MVVPEEIERTDKEIIGEIWAEGVECTFKSKARPIEVLRNTILPAVGYPTSITSGRPSADLLQLMCVVHCVVETKIRSDETLLETIRKSFGRGMVYVVPVDDLEIIAEEGRKK